jgi:molybdate transport system permease protein
VEENLTFTVCLTLGVSLLSTLILLPLGIPLAWFLARKSWPGKWLVESFVSLPLVLPPVATGLLLLKIFGRNGIVGKPLHDLGIEVAFTWRAVVIACAAMSFPLLVRSCRTAFEEVNPRFENLARTLGAGEWRLFFEISIPLAWRGIMAGALLAFARALGEFGATIMVAGNIPGETSTLALGIYHSVQLGEDRYALQLAGISLALALPSLLISEYLLLSKKRRQR